MTMLDILLYNLNLNLIKNVKDGGFWLNKYLISPFFAEKPQKKQEIPISKYIDIYFKHDQTKLPRMSLKLGIAIFAWMDI